ncbi:MAG: amidohydrolase [Ruminococcus sp.]|nr:amidohydrolase [Ruminococcus sp.]
MIRFYNGLVLTMQGEIKPEEAEVWVDGDKIAFVGVPTAQQLDSAVFERQTDLGGDLIMPSLKNAHTHSAMTFLRSFADGLPLHEWLTQQIFPMEAKLDDERIYWFTKLAILEYLSSGCTAALDMYFYLDSYVSACTESGFRCIMCSADSGDANALTAIEDAYVKYNKPDRPFVKYIPGLHAEYTCSKELIEGIGALAKKYRTPTSAHNSETASEVAGCIERYGMTPTQLFESVGAYDFGGVQYHCVHLSQQDIDIFKRRGITAVHCPASNLKLASGIADIKAMSNAGINVALGTDGPASNNALDMFREMYLMSVLQNIKYKDAAAFDALDVLRAATVGGAKAMYLDDCDVIAEGKQADLIVIDLHKPNMQPINNIPKNIVYSGGKSNVRLTMCAGKVLYECGEYHIGEQPEKIYAKVQSLVDEMK